MRLRISALSVLMLVPLSANAMGIDVIIGGQTVTFKDVPQSAWFSTYVHDAAEAGIVNGYLDASGHPTGLFGPSNNVTFAQALKVAIEGADYDTSAYSNVIDAGVGSHWAAPYVSVAKGEDFSMVNGTLRLDRSATRAEVAEMIAAAFRVSIDTEAGAGFKDVNPASSDAPIINALARDKVITGDTDSAGNPTNTFRPSDYINRAEVVKMILLARTTYGEPGKGRSPEEQSSVGQTENMVTYGDDGFSPAVLHVKAGTTVTFKNDTTGSMRVQSTTSIATFDEMQPTGQGGIYTYTFNTVGTWGYHNYLHPSDTGTIVVDQ